MRTFSEAHSAFDKLINRYRQNELRQLVWSCYSGPLVNALPNSNSLSLQPNPENADLSLLDALEQDPTPLLNELATQTSQRLGLRFESLWHFFLKNQKDIELIAHNHPIRADGRTLGELDILYFCKRRQRAIHLELAVKFYLGVTTAEGVAEWPGPNVQDSLDRKLNHLTDHQLQLSKRAETELWLNQLGYADVDREFVIKGYLFYPENQKIATHQLASNNHNRGIWQTLNQLQETIGNNENPLTVNQWAFLDKPQWISKLLLDLNSPQKIGGTALIEAIEMRFAKRPDTPVMVARLGENSEGEWLEIERRFIVPDQWLVKSGHVFR